MTDEISANADSKDGNESSSVPPWLRATLVDLKALDFESPITSSTTADCGELSELFQTAAQPPSASGELHDTSIARVFAMLSAVTGMYFKSEERNEPFGPMVVFPDGRRSAIPSDFRGGPIDVLAEMAEQAKNPVLRARLADVCWLLERKRSNLGNLAVAMYVEIVRLVDNGRLRYRFQENDEAFHFETRDHLRRAL
jgi:hypothetical protein